MMQLLGPSYRYNGETLSQPQVIVVRDHHYDEHNQKFHLLDLLTNSKCEAMHHRIIFDHVLQHEDQLQGFNLIYFPSFMARENSEFIQQNIVPNWNNKTRCFNFMINKPRPHRIQLLELIAKHKLHNFSHSLAWQSNTVNSIPVTNYKFGSETVMSRGIRNGHYKNAYTYQHLLQTSVFEPSCLSLITEPVYYERETIITEKTLMAMWAGTMPLWVGGWRIPDYMKSLGFDCFDDIIDHSYQNLPDPAERVEQAIQRNLDLLTNFDRALWLNRQCQQRLETNLTLLQQNPFRQICHSIIEQSPEFLQPTLKNLLG